MRILIDIGHPAHVHYFRNFIKIMENRGHCFLVTARDKEITHSLLNNYKIEYTSRGKGKKGLIGKFLYMIEADYDLLRLAKTFQPVLALSFGSAYAAQVSKLIGISHIAFDDTEHAKIEHIMYSPFSKSILTPESFKKDFGHKHIRFRGSMDMAYLHPDYFKLNKDYLEKLQLKDNAYFFLRFVKWTASHDLGHSGFTDKGKIKIVDLLSGYGDVIISSEGSLPEELSKYIYKGDPAQIHSVLKCASMFISESGSMATEAAILGTPSIMVNTSAKHFGVFEYISKYGNLFYFDDEYQAFEKIIFLLGDKNLKEKSMNNAQAYIRDTINLTDFMVWFVENYPESFKTVRENPHYQFKFR